MVSAVSVPRPLDSLVSGSLDVEPCTELSGRRGINAARGMSDKEKIFDPLRHRAQRLYAGDVGQSWSERLSTQKVKALTA